MQLLQQVKRCRKADKIKIVTPDVGLNPEDTQRRCTVKRIPAVPSGGGFADYSTMLHLTSLETAFTVVVCLIKFMTQTDNREELRRKEANQK